jgi:Lon protease-like protein
VGLKALRHNACMDVLASPLPLFPLQTVLFPGGVLPLRIFEVRYLDLIGRCHREGTPFGVVTLTQGTEVRSASGPQEAFHAVGTLATITQFERPQQGVMMVRCEGGQRFTVQSSRKLTHGLWVASVNPMAPDSVVPVPGELRHLATLLAQMVAQLQQQEAGTERARDLLPEPQRWDDCGWLANRWCELLPIQAELKQRSMALDNPILRLELVDDMLERLGIKAARLGKS